MDFLVVCDTINENRIEKKKTTEFAWNSARSVLVKGELGSLATRSLRGSARSMLGKHEARASLFCIMRIAKNDILARCDV